MEIREMQGIVDKWVKQYAVGYWDPRDQVLRLVEEVGELAREINHEFGQKPRKKTENKKNIGYELADIIFTVVCIANKLEIDLEEAFEHVMKKYTERDRNRYERK
jgi:NTP pyrophosphatase (non-canonical NTP hydrolase)